METQSGTISQILAGYQRYPTLLESFLRLGSHPDRIHQQTSQQSTCKPYWHQKNTRTYYTKILLANAPP